MKQETMEAQVRTETGKGVARKLRASGKIPAVLYGPRNEPVALAVNDHDFNRILFKAKGDRILFSINLNNNGNSETRLALIKSLQRHPVNDKIRHIDFYEVFMDQPVEVDVRLAFVGKAKGVEIEKGVLDILQRSLKVACLPTNIPNEIEIDVTELGLGEAIHVSDVVPPEGVKILDDPKMPLVTITGSAATSATEEEEEEEEE